MDLADHSLLSPQQREALLAELSGCATVQEVVRWAFALSPPGEVCEVVIQDEYSHDLVLRFRDGRYLAFDTS